MTCPKCGYPNENGTAYCEQCGQRLQSSTPVQEPVQHFGRQYPPEGGVPHPEQQRPVYGGGYADTSYTPPVRPVRPTRLSSNPVLNNIKTVGSSVMFLAAAVLLGVSVLLEFISLFVDKRWIYDLLGVLGEAAEFGMKGVGGISFALVFIVIVDVLFIINAIGMAVGMFMMHFHAKDYTTGGISTLSLKIFNICAYVGLGTWSIIFLVGEIAGLVCLFTIPSSIPGVDITVPTSFVKGYVFDIMLILAVVALAMVFFWYKILGVVSNIRYSAETGKATEKISKAVYICEIVFFGLNIWLALSAFPFGQWLSGFAFIVVGVSDLLIFNLMNKYNSGTPVGAKTHKPEVRRPVSRPAYDPDAQGAGEVNRY